MKWDETDPNGRLAEANSRIELTLSHGSNYDYGADFTLISDMNGNPDVGIGCVVAQAYLDWTDEGINQAAGGFFLWRDTDNFAGFHSRDSVAGNVALLIKVGGSIVYSNQTSGIANAKDFKVVHYFATQTVSFWYWNGTSWVLIDAVQTGVNFGGALKFCITAQDNTTYAHADTVIIDDAYLVFTDYSTHYPAGTSASPSLSISPTPSASPSLSPSSSVSASISPSPSSSVSASISPSPSSSVSASISPSPSSSLSPSPSVSVSASISPSPSLSASSSVSLSPSPSPSPSSSVSPSPSASPSQTDSPSPSLSPSSSQSPSASPSPSPSASVSLSPSSSFSLSPSISVSSSPSSSQSPSSSVSPSPSPPIWSDKYEVKNTSYNDKYSVRNTSYNDKYEQKNTTWQPKYREFE